MKASKLLALMLGLASGTALLAGPIFYDAGIHGLSAPAGVSFSATGGDLVLGYKNNIEFLGVNDSPSGDDPAGPEIDIGQSVVVSFDEAQTLSSLTLALLFNGPEYDDGTGTLPDYGEIAASLISGGDIYTLTVIGENLGEWALNGTFLSHVTGYQTVQSGLGLWTIENPFGSSMITSLEVYPLDTNPPEGHSNSDFGLVGFRVPDAGSTLALIGVSMLGIGALSRRLRR